MACVFPQRPPESGRHPGRSSEEDPLVHSDTQESQSHTHSTLLIDHLAGRSPLRQSQLRKHNE